MTALLERLLGRLPIGWLQLTHNRTRLIAALAGVAFANLLIFMQLGFLGALLRSIGLPYEQMQAQLLIQASDANTLEDGSPCPAAHVRGARSRRRGGAVPLFIGRLDWKQPDGTVGGCRCSGSTRRPTPSGRGNQRCPLRVDASRRRHHRPGNPQRAEGRVPDDRRGTAACLRGARPGP